MAARTVVMRSLGQKRRTEGAPRSVPWTHSPVVDLVADPEGQDDEEAEPPDDEIDGDDAEEGHGRYTA
jgi:hypothetical protein